MLYNIIFFFELLHIDRIAVQLLYNQRIFHRDKFVNINDHRITYFYKAFHKTELDLCNFIFKLKISSLIDIFHSGKFSAIQEFFCKAHMVPNDNPFHICDNHSLTIFHILISRQKSFTNNRPHLHFFYKNRLLNAFFCMGNINRNDNFFSIYAFHTLIFFRTSYRTEK